MLHVLANGSSTQRVCTVTTKRAGTSMDRAQKAPQALEGSTFRVGRSPCHVRVGSPSAHALQPQAVLGPSFNALNLSKDLKPGMFNSLDFVAWKGIR